MGFRNADKSGNGLLEGDEIDMESIPDANKSKERSAKYKVNKSEVLEEAEKSFDKMDKNHDGVLTMEEIAGNKMREMQAKQEQYKAALEAKQAAIAKGAKNNQAADDDSDDDESDNAGNTQAKPATSPNAGTAPPAPVGIAPATGIAQLGGR